jgi:2-dehydropantoate 2-reductase
MLHAKGHQVLLFGKRKLKNIGNEIFINHKMYQVPKKVFSLPQKEKFDVIFITTKLYDLEKMIKLILKHKLQTPILVSIQNGLVDNSRYKKLLKKQRLIILSVFEGFRLLANQLIMTPTKMGWKIESSREGRQVSRLLREAGIWCQAELNLDAYRAEKTIVNCCLNALSALEKKPFNRLFSLARTKKRIDRLFIECYQIVSQEHSLAQPEIIKNRLYQTWSAMNHYSSTCQDVLSGRKTEIDFLNGYMVVLAKKHGFNAPENQKIITDFRRLYKES